MPVASKEISPVPLSSVESGTYFGTRLTDAQRANTTIHDMRRLALELLPHCGMISRWHDKAFGHLKAKAVNQARDSVHFA